MKQGRHTNEVGDLPGFTRTPPANRDHTANQDKQKRWGKFYSERREEVGLPTQNEHTRQIVKGNLNRMAQSGISDIDMAATVAVLVGAELVGFKYKSPQRALSKVVENRVPEIESVEDE